MKEPGRLLKEMIDRIPTLAWSCRPDGTAEFLNQRWLDYTGPSLEEALGWGWKASIHPEDLDKLMDTWLRLPATGEPGEEEARPAAVRWRVSLVPIPCRARPRRAGRNR